MNVTLKIRKEGKNWIFDDERLGIVKEPFVEGTSEMIDSLIPEEEWGDEHVVTASDYALKGEYYLTFLIDFDKETSWSTYHCLGFGQHKLCPVLLKYFEEPPQDIYFMIE